MDAVDDLNDYGRVAQPDDDDDDVMLEKAFVHKITIFFTNSVHL